jgi:Gpi18-like mannosyltransferase
MAPSSWRAPAPLLVAIVVSVLIHLAIAAATPGYVADIGTNKTWGRWIAREGIADAYRIPTDYPPVLLYFFGAAGWAYRALVDPSFNERAALASQTYTFLIKLPGILFHGPLALAIYAAARPAGLRAATLAGVAYALNPAVAYDVAHLGQTDPVHALFALLAVSAVAGGSWALAGASAAAAALTKPQAWLLLPLIGLLVLARGRVSGVWRATVGGVATGVLILLPWLIMNRVHHLPRFFEYLETKSVNSTALAAHSHNAWWLWVLAEWRFINDWEPIIGPITFRMAGLGIVLALVLAATVLALSRPPSALYAIVGTLVVGWFLFTVRAHENHLFMAIPFFAVAWAFDRRFGLILALASTSLLLNIALHDPLLVSNYAAGPDPGHPLPVWIVGSQVANVLLNVLVFVMAVTALARRSPTL